MVQLFRLKGLYDFAVLQVDSYFSILAQLPNFHEVLITDAKTIICRLVKS